MATSEQPPSSMPPHSAEPPQPAPVPGRPESVASAFEPLLTGAMHGTVPVRFEFFDGSAVGPDGGDAVVRVRSRDAARRMMYAPGELGLARAYVAGDLELEGDAYAV